MNNIDIIYFDVGNTLVNFKNNKKKNFRFINRRSNQLYKQILWYKYNT